MLAIGRVICNPEIKLNQESRKTGGSSAVFCCLQSAIENLKSKMSLSP